MEFISNNPDMCDQERQKFLVYLSYYSRLFDRNQCSRVENQIYDKIGRVNINSLKEPVIENGKLNIGYEVGKGKDVDKYSALNEMGHALLLSSSDNNCSYNNSLPFLGPCKYISSLDEYYGKGIEVGTVSMLANIAILKNDYPSYLDSYIKTGRNCFKKNEYKLMEDLARLLSIASIPLCNDSADDLVNCISNSKINDNSSSLYLRSCLNNDFGFESDFNKLFEDSYACYNLFKDIDILYRQVPSKRIEFDLLQSVVLRINSYYMRRIEQYLIMGKVDSNKFDELISEFNGYVESILDCYMKKNYCA